MRHGGEAQTVELEDERLAFEGRVVRDVPDEDALLAKGKVRLDGAGDRLVAR